MNQTDLRQISSSALKSWLENNGEKTFRIKQINHWLWKQAVDTIDQMSNLSKSLREKLNKDFVLTTLDIKHKQISSDKTIKVGFQLNDNKIIEGVLIPTENRVTACISTQVGCKMGCRFCATATLGFGRHLTAAEIFMQVYKLNELSQQHYDINLSNVVIMGMGEPLDNYQATKTAVEYMCNETGMAMSYRRITLSTVGIAPMIKQMADDGLKINLSVSLHAPNNQLRNQIMPANNKYPLEMLADALTYYHQKTGIRISYEYLLLKDINDSVNHAKELAEFTKITPCKINLIEYNPVEGKEYKRSKSDKTTAFINFLEKCNLIVNLRRSRGSDVDAACGQLANKVKNNSKM